MIKTIRLDRKDNYLIDSETKLIVDRYDPDNKNLQLVLQLEDSTLRVDSSKIVTEFGNQIAVQHNDNKYIIDDGYQNILTKAGYIVYKNYDDEYIYDRNQGIKTRDYILKEISKSLYDIANNYQDIIGKMDENESSENNIVIGDKYAPYKVSIVTDTVSSIVTKNQLRKDNSLPFYPFNKTMDKYGTIYISIFTQKNRRMSDEEKNIKYQISDSIIKDLINNLGVLYHFIPQMIKRRVIKAKGI